MKISKKKIETYMQRGKEYAQYVSDCFLKVENYLSVKDDHADKLWKLYYTAMKDDIGYELLDVLNTMICSAINNNWTVDNIANALRALNVEVEE